MEIEGNPSTAFHPQTDRQTERINHELEKYLWAFTKSNQTDWSEWVGVATFALNNPVASATGYSPFYLNHRRDSCTIINIPRSKVNKSVDDFISCLERARKDATAAIELMNAEMKKQTDKHWRPSNDIAIGTEVWLDTLDIKIPNAPKTMKKLSDKHVGPFKVLEKIGASAYKLELPEQWKIHPTFNESNSHRMYRHWLSTRSALHLCHPR